eukprot:UN11399
MGNYPNGDITIFLVIYRKLIYFVRYSAVERGLHRTEKTELIDEVLYKV